MSSSGAWSRRSSSPSSRRSPRCGWRSVSHSRSRCRRRTSCPGRNGSNRNPAFRIRRARSRDMKRPSSLTAWLAASALVGVQSAWAGQAPGSASDPDVPISHRDRVYAAEQFSNTVSVTDPADNKLLGVIRLGEPSPTNFIPPYRWQALVHGMGFSPDHRTLAVVSIGSNSVSFIDTATNAVKHTTYVGRSPHEAFFTPDGREVWVTVRGENYISVLDAKSFKEKTRIITPS